MTRYYNNSYEFTTNNGVYMTPAGGDAVYFGMSAAIAATGQVAAGSFVIGTAGTDADAVLIYDSTTGARFYDADGTGSALAVRFASLHAHLALTNADFVVI